MTETWIGVDPGFQGAIAVLDNDGQMIWVWDMPLVNRKGRTRQRECDLPALNGIFRAVASCSPSPVFLEWPTTRPDEAAEASKRFGVGLGQVEAMSVANGLAIVRVSPNKWKLDLGLPGKKNKTCSASESRHMACDRAVSLIPNVTAEMVHGPRGGALDGRAEALLIAWHAWSKTFHGMRTIRGRAGGSAYDDTQMMAHVLTGSRRRRKVKPGGLF